MGSIILDEAFRRFQRRDGPDRDLLAKRLIYVVQLLIGLYLVEIIAPIALLSFFTTSASYWVRTIFPWIINVVFALIVYNKISVYGRTAVYVAFLCAVTPLFGGIFSFLLFAMKPRNATHE